MPSFGSIIMKRACFILVRQMSNDTFCTRIIRPGTSITRQTLLGAGTPRKITTIFTQSLSRLQTPVRFSLQDQPMQKTELVKHIHHHDPKLMNVIVGVETVDHPSDAQLVAYARKYFNAADRMQSQKGQNP
jgi:hypothetical protein